METPEQICFKVNNEDTRTEDFLYCSAVLITEFGQVNAGRVKNYFWLRK